MIHRFASELLTELSSGFPSVLVTGPRQSGKTTLVRAHFKGKPYVSFENLNNQDLFNHDPIGFLQKYEDGAIFDEVQNCPSLLSYLQQMIDLNPTPGRFILTGSQHFGILSKVSQSLSGRIGILRLLPFSMHECYEEQLSDVSLDAVLFKGFYPPLYDRKLRPHLWYGSYVQSYIERDVRQLVNVQNLSQFQRFVRLCAGRIGQLLNLSHLASDCGITHKTARSWISILEESDLIFLLKPYLNNFNKRLVKTPKLYFYDTGLAAWLLGIQNEEQLNQHPLRGQLFETLILNEWLKHKLAQGRSEEVYFWRDRSGHEVDMIIDASLSQQPIEIKSGKTLNSDYFKNLEQWIDIPQSNPNNPILVYGGNEPHQLKNIEVVPWTQWMKP